MAGLRTVDELWRMLAERPYPMPMDAFDAALFSARFPEARRAILAAAERALAHRIDLLGSGPVDLGETIDWLRDYKTGDRWPPAFCRAIDYVNKGRPSDVKVPWEISRLHWLLPAGQAYLLTGEERYAEGAREVLSQWIAANPLGWTVNWSCTMEPALRILAWTWLFRVFWRAPSWGGEDFRSRFLSSLYLHGLFTDVHIERSTINGNHLTADAAALVFAGLFFRGIGDADRWQAEGWRTLEQEIRLQVHPDGVDFEASSAYHRLVAELFLLPARYRLACGLPAGDAYAERLRAMGRFIAAYSRPDGTSPNWGDADDGRALPMGTQARGDHRYLTGLVALTFDDPELMALPWGAGDELAWHEGTECLSRKLPEAPATSAAFRDGGVFVLRNASAHVFIDCGPVGLAGLGGHGHNDALSFEAWLAGEPLIVDPGSFVYTASFEDRNLFRSTAMHNTPRVDGEEINRFLAPDNLWNLHEDARAEATLFEADARGGRFAGRHHGYQRLPGKVLVERAIVLEGERLSVADTISGGGRHLVEVPLHFAPGVEVAAGEDGAWRLTTPGGAIFRLNFAAEAVFAAFIEESRVSPSYGVALPARRLVWRAEAELPMCYGISIAPLAASGG
jgi:hypothetical protein